MNTSAADLSTINAAELVQRLSWARLERPRISEPKTLFLERSVRHDQSLAEHDIGVPLGPPCKFSHTFEACLFIHSRRLKVITCHPDSASTTTCSLRNKSVE